MDGNFIFTSKWAFRLQGSFPVVDFSRTVATIFSVLFSLPFPNCCQPWIFLSVASRISSFNLHHLTLSISCFTNLSQPHSQNLCSYLFSSFSFLHLTNCLSGKKRWTGKLAESVMVKEDQSQSGVWGHVKDIWLLGWGSDWGQVLQSCLKIWHGGGGQMCALLEGNFTKCIPHAIIEVASNPVGLQRLGMRKVVNCLVRTFGCTILHWRSKFTNGFYSCL